MAVDINDALSKIYIINEFYSCLIEPKLILNHDMMSFNVDLLLILILIIIGIGIIIIIIIINMMSRNVKFRLV